MLDDNLVRRSNRCQIDFFIPVDQHLGIPVKPFCQLLRLGEFKTCLFQFVHQKVAVNHLSSPLYPAVYSAILPDRSAVPKYPPD